MTVKIFTGWEAGINGAHLTSGGGAGTFSIQSSVKKTGTYALRCNPTTTNAGRCVYTALGANGLANDANITSTTSAYITFWFRVDTLPAANYEIFLRSHNTTGARALLLCISSGGLISVRDSTDSLVATGATALSTATWYQISLMVSKGAAGAYEVKINGNAELSGTCSQTTSNVGGVALGKHVDVNGQSVDYYFDDLVVDDAEYVTDSQCAVMRANADGSTQQWTAGTGASNYLEVDEIPPDGGTTYVKCSTAGNQVALFAFESCSTAGISASSIRAATPTINVAEDSSVTSANSLRTRSGGNNYDTTAVNQTTAYRVVGLVYATDPATAAAWTVSGLDALEAGSIEANAVAMRLDSVFVEVCYVPAPAGTYRGFFAAAV